MQSNLTPSSEFVAFLDLSDKLGELKLLVFLGKRHREKFMSKRSQTLPNAPSSAPPPPNFPKNPARASEMRYTVPYNRKTRPRPRSRPRPYHTEECLYLTRKSTQLRTSKTPAAHCPPCPQKCRNVRPKRPTDRQKARQNASLRVKNTTGRYWTSTGPTRAHFRQPGAPDNPSAKKIMVRHLGTFGDICPTFTPKREEFGPMRQRRRMSAISVLQACKLCDQRPHGPGLI